MGRLYIPRRGLIDPRTVPTGDVEVDPDHPLAPLAGWIPGGSRGLAGFGEAGVPLTAGPYAGFSGSARGPGLLSASNNNSIASSATVPAALQLATAGTLFWFGQFNGAPLSSVDPTPIGVVVNYVETSPNYCYALNFSATALYFATNNGSGTAEAYSVSATIPTSGVHSFAASFVYGSIAALYMDGAFIGNVTIPYTPAYSTPTIVLGGDLYGGGRAVNGVTLAGHIFGHSLPASLHAWLAAEPFAMLRERAPPVAYYIASGGGGTLVGTAAATSTATATLAGTGTLTGTAAATSTATGTLVGAGTLAGTSAAASTATGTLAGGGLLTGTAAATSTATGTLAGAAALAGTAAATSTATGTLSSGAYLVGTAAATSTATGTLAGTGALTGTADATSTTTGTLAGAGRMTGTAAATSTAPAFLIGFGPISGIAAATSTATGTLASRSWVFRTGRIVNIPADIRTAAIPADIRTVQ